MWSVWSVRASSSVERLYCTTRQRSVSLHVRRTIAHSDLTAATCRLHLLITRSQMWGLYAMMLSLSIGLFVRLSPAKFVKLLAR